MRNDQPCRHSNLGKQNMKQSESNAMEVTDEQIKKHTLAYYRSSSEHPTAHSISLQQAHVRAWAAKHGIAIIREYSDVGKSGSISEERPAFDEMLNYWVMERSDFGYVLCVDASRIGRFQVIELNVQFNKHCKQLIYTGTSKVVKLRIRGRNALEYGFLLSQPGLTHSG